VPDVGGGATVGPAALLVDGDDSHAWLVEERVLHAVAVVRVKVHVQHSLDATLEQPPHGEHRVIEIAEAAGTVAPAVVRASGRVEHGASLERQFRGEQRTADCRGRALEDAGEQRVLEVAESVPLADGRRNATGGVAGPQRLDVASVVVGREFRDGRGATRPRAAGIEPAERFADLQDCRDPRDGQRVVPAETGLAAEIARHEQCGPSCGRRVDAALRHEFLAG